jgi:hypothetical protein
LEGIPDWIFSPPHPLMMFDVMFDDAPGPSSWDEVMMFDDAPGPSSWEEEQSAPVSLVLRELTGVIQRRDVSALERILTEDYIGIVGPDLTNYYNRARQIAMVETGDSPVEPPEFRNHRVYPSGAGESALITTFTGPSLFKIRGGDSSAECRHYLRLDKQSEQWTVSAIYINQTSSNPESVEFTCDSL